MPRNPQEEATALRGRAVAEGSYSGRSGAACRGGGGRFPRRCGGLCTLWTYVRIARLPVVPALAEAGESPLVRALGGDGEPAADADPRHAQLREPPDLRRAGHEQHV